MANQDQKNEYAKSVALFLAELLRTRKISISRASEIAGRVVNNINLIDTEEDFLKLIKELMSDFDELDHLHKLVTEKIQISKRVNLENRVREFASQTIITDLTLAANILSDAVSYNCTLEALCAKYPSFKQFMEYYEHR